MNRAAAMAAVPQPSYWSLLGKAFLGVSVSPFFRLDKHPAACSVHSLSVSSDSRWVLRCLGDVPAGPKLCHTGRGLA